MAQKIRYYLCADPTTTPGVEIGRRHFPLNVPFQNGPTRSKVFRTDRLHHRGAENGRARLADAGGVPLGGPQGPGPCLNWTT